MGHTPVSGRRKRRGPRPVDRLHLERHCQRCGASRVEFFNAPADWTLGLCSYCEHQFVKLMRE